MLPLGNNLAVVHHDYDVGCNNCTEPVGDYEAGSVLHDFLDGLVDLGLAVGVNLTCSLIED
jgi:hypothetical protein